NLPMWAGIPCRSWNASRHATDPAPPEEMSVPSMSNRIASGPCSPSSASTPPHDKGLRAAERACARPKLARRDYSNPAGPSPRLLTGIGKLPMNPGAQMARGPIRADWRGRAPARKPRFRLDGQDRRCAVRSRRVTRPALACAPASELDEGRVPPRGARRRLRGRGPHVVPGRADGARLLPRLRGPRGRPDLRRDRLQWSRQYAVRPLLPLEQPLRLVLLLEPCRCLPRRSDGRGVWGRPLAAGAARRGERCELLGLAAVGARALDRQVADHDRHSR